MFTIGCDPEFFLKLEEKHRSAIGMIGGSKDEPRPLEKDGHAVLEDNVAVEFNIAPAHNHQEFIDNIQYVLNELRKSIPRQFEFSHESAVIFDADELMHPQALEFGCEPDFNAWTREMNPRPCAANQNLRSAGGHIHVGIEGDISPVDIIRAMDIYVGVPSTKMDKHGALRRELYGNYGCYRPKPYGAEYRTLSNFWIFSPDLIKWAYDQTAKAVAFLQAGGRIEDHVETYVKAAFNGHKDAYEYLSETYGFTR